MNGKTRGGLGIGLGVCCGIVGITFIILALGVFEFLKGRLYDSVGDLQHIDGTTQTDDEKGDDFDEKTQFDSFLRSTKDEYDKCMRDSDKESDECLNGFPRTVGVFNVTNSIAVVRNGAKPIVQEVGPIYARLFFEQHIMNDSQKANFDSSGIAEIREGETFYLDNDTCLADCQALLQQYVIIPNPVWANLVHSGAETIVVMVLWFAAKAQEGSTAAAAAGTPQAAATYILPLLMDATSGLGASQTEAGAFMIGIVQLLPAGALTAVANLGVFMTQVGAAVATGDLTGTCSIGGFTMDFQRCGALATRLQAIASSMGPTLLSGYETLYGVGNAMPVFIKVTVAQALGFKTTFTDPLTATPVPLPALLDDLDAVGSERAYRLASKFGDQGIKTYAMYDGVTKECSVDPDCSLAAGRGNCVESATCNPLKFAHYTTSRIPGRVWEQNQGSSNFGVNSVYPVLIIGLPLQFKITAEEEMTVKGAKLKYLVSKVNALSRRVENCAGNSTPGDSAGIDCDGPLNTINVAPRQKGIPFYGGLPFWSSGGLEDLNATNDGSWSTSWDGSSRVTMLPCTGNSWCTDNRPDKYKSYVYFEPESGYPIEMHIAVQFNLRICSKQSPLHASCPDAAVPIFWYTQDLSLSDTTRKKLADLQGLPAFAETMTVLFLVLGIIMLLVSSGCVIAGIFLCSKTSSKVTDMHSTSAVVPAVSCGDSLNGDAPASGN